MNANEIKQHVDAHAVWLRGEGGARWVCIWNEDLSGANLSRANLRGADLRGANLRGADLRGANLSVADLRDADLSEADLSGADLRGANLRGADLSGADLRRANLRGADLREANLSGANLRGADLSGARGLPTAREFMRRFERDALGWIVYKRIGDTQFSAPAHWKIEPGAFLEEVVNPCPVSNCACGVNFGTLEWCKDNYTCADLWKCRIRFEDAPDIVVPYHTDGKARCGRLELIEKVE